MIWFLKKILYSNFIRSGCAKVYLFLRDCNDSLRYEAYRKKYDIPSTFRFNGSDIILHGEGKIVIGDHSIIGTSSTIQAIAGSSVKIGKRCQISHYVKIYTYNLVTDQDFSAPSLAMRTAPVIIGDYVWIGANVFIKEGITIGDNTVIGANSVVTKNIPANCIAAGCPAKVIRFKQF